MSQQNDPKCSLPAIRKGERKPTDPEERLNEEDVHVLESFLEEAHANGTGKLARICYIKICRVLTLT